MKRPSTSRNGESGFSIAIGVFIVVGLMAAVGLAVDAGQIYRDKLRLQRALDAGAVGGSKLLSNDDTDEDAGPLARQIALNNLAAMGLRPGDVNVWFENPPPKPGVLALHGTIKARTMLLRVLPGVRDTTIVAATSRAAQKPTMIALVLDFSGSMVSVVGGKRKIDALKDAAIKFIGLFEPGMDFMSLVIFAGNAYVPTDANMTKHFMQNSTASKNFDNIVSAQVVAYDAGLTADPRTWPTGTNHDFGLRLAQRQMLHDVASHSYLETANKAIVIVTDGAPTASCSNDRTNADFNLHETELGSVTDASLCTIAPATAPGDPAPWMHWNTEELVHYDRSLQQADRARVRIPDVKIFTVGIGALSGTSLERTDPYQDYHDQSSLKSNFLRRMANVEMPAGVLTDPSVYFNQGRELVGTVNLPIRYPILPFAAYQAAMENGIPVHPQVGEYLFTASGTDLGDLDDILLSIGLSLKSRLIE